MKPYFSLRPTLSNATISAIRVRRVSDQGQPIGDGNRGHSELLDDAGLVEHDLAAPIPTDDALSRHQLGEILVG